MGSRTDEVFFIYNTWGFEVHIFPYVSVDFEDITSICNECGFNLNHSAFINLRLFQEIKLHGFNPDLRWQMQISETDRFILLDDEPGCNRLETEIVSLLPLALNFFSQNESIDSIDRLFNTRPIERYSPYCSGLDTRCMIGLISAKLSRNSADGDIKQMYQQIVEREDFTAEMKYSFTRVTACLDNYVTMF